MSHLSKITTQIYDLKLLKNALSDLHLEWKVDSTELSGFQGKIDIVDLVIEQENGIDVGFSWNGKGATRLL